MKRVSNLWNYIKEDIKGALDRFEQSLTSMEIDAVKRGFWQSKDYVGSDSDCFVCSYLRSSMITQSHRFKLAVYDKEPFVDASVYHTFLDLSPLYVQVADDLESWEAKLRPKFSRIFPSEMEEIRRAYIERLYQHTSLLFERVIRELSDGEKIVPVYFTEEMGDLKQIGVIGI